MLLPTLQIILLTHLAIAVWIDHRSHRIPNALSGSLLLFAITIQTATGQVDGLTNALTGAAVGFAIFLVPYLRRGMAAGDVKLMTAVGACIGPGQALLAGLASFTVGGGFALLLLTYRFYRPDSSGTEAVLGSRFPFASSIAIGTSMVLLVQGA